MNDYQTLRQMVEDIFSTGESTKILPFSKAGREITLNYHTRTLYQWIEERFGMMLHSGTFQESK